MPNDSTTRSTGPPAAAADRVGPHGRKLVARARRSTVRSRELIAASRGLIAASTDRLGNRAWAGLPQTEDEGGLSIAAGVALAGLDQLQLWLAYTSLGGDHSREHLADFLNGDVPWGRHDVNMLAHALNEHLWQLGLATMVGYID